MTDTASGTITIDAPPAKVMNVIADFGAYPQWATGVKQCEVLETGPDGRPRQVRFAVSLMVINDEYVNAYSWDGDTRVTWEQQAPGKTLKSQQGRYVLTPADGGTHVEYQLDADVKLPFGLPAALKAQGNKVIVDAALSGLKRRVESLG